MEQVNIGTSTICEPGDQWVGVGEGKGAGVIMVGYYEAFKHHHLMLTWNNNVPGLTYSNEAVFMLSETACSEGQACRFPLITIH